MNRLLIVLMATASVVGCSSQPSAVNETAQLESPSPSGYGNNKPDYNGGSPALSEKVRSPLTEEMDSAATEGVAKRWREARDIALNAPTPENMEQYRVAYRDMMMQAYSQQFAAAVPRQPPRSHQEQAKAARQLVEAELPAAFVAHQPHNQALYFGFDSFHINATWGPVILEHSTYLQSHPDMRAMVAGYADLRGNERYNMALGQRRAQAVANALIAHGVRSEQLSVVSYGESNPVFPGNSKAAYAANRRVEISY